MITTKSLYPDNYCLFVGFKAGDESLHSGNRTSTEALQHQSHPCLLANGSDVFRGSEGMAGEGIRV
jgi:hypothetical protein